MKRALIDASSAILLHKAGLFDTMVSAYRLMMTPAVCREVTVEGRRGAAHFKDALRRGCINIVQAPTEAYGDSGLSRLGAGERDTLCAYRGGGVDFVILDDRKGVAFCRSGAIPHINALLCPKILHWAGHLDRSARARAIACLLDEGRYGRYVIDFAMKSDVQRLRVFLPDSGEFPP